MRLTSDSMGRRDDIEILFLLCRSACPEPTQLQRGSRGEHSCPMLNVQGINVSIFSLCGLAIFITF